MATIEIVEAGQGADDGVLVEHVDVVVAGPGAARPDRLEGRHAGGEHRPDRLLEPAVVDLEVVAAGSAVLGRRGAAEIDRAFGPDIDAARIDQQREARQRLAAVEGEDEALPRLDRQVDAERRGERAASPVPAAMTTVPPAMRVPSASRTPVTRPPSRSIATTSAVISSTPSARALRRNACIRP